MRTAPAEFAELAFDPPIAPAGILSGQPKNQRLQLHRQPRSPKPLPAPSKQRPFAAHQFPMPPQQGLGRDQEGTPVRSRKALAQGGEHQSIRSLPASTAELPFQNAKLLPENHDLQLQRGIPSTDHQQVDNEEGKTVDQGQEHRPSCQIHRGCRRLPRSTF
jgi:hypothetical protein